MCPWKKVEKEAVQERIPTADVMTFHKNGTATAKRGYFYRNRVAEDNMMAEIKAIPGARVVDMGWHERPICGGAEPGSAKDTYHWIQFAIDGPRPAGEYWIRYKVFDHQDRQVTKQKVFGSRTAREEYMEKVKITDSFAEFVATVDEDGVKGVA